jgi:hypothetical protein
MMATAQASPPEPPRQPAPAQGRQDPNRVGSERRTDVIAAAVEVVREVETRREMTRLEREARWACEWWPPD